MSRTHRPRLLLGAVAFWLALGIGGCAPGVALIPTEVYEEINADSREWTYDVAWQNTRMLSFSVVNDELADLTDQALVLTARLHRLETARADAMANRATARAVADLEVTVGGRSVEENHTRLGALAPQIEVLFDAGDFAGAKLLVLEVVVISRWLENTR